MAKGEAKRTNRYIDQEREKIGSQYGNIDSELASRLGGARDRADRSFDSAYSGYNDVINRSRSGSNRNPASFDPSQYNELYKRFKDFGDSGGVNAEQTARIRGNGVFDEFAKTGGLSEADKQNLRARSTSTLPAFFQNLKQNLDRTKTVQGGYSPGYDAQTAQLARDQAYGANQVAAEAEGDITDRVTSGRQWGASSLSDAERSLVDQISRNKLGGWGGALNTRQSSGNEALQYADLLNRDKGMDLEAELAALGGLRGLRTDQPGEEFGLYDRMLESAGGRAGHTGQNLNLRAEYNPNKSIFDRISQIGGAVAGAAPAFSQFGRRGRNTGVIPGSRNNPQTLPHQRNRWSEMYG